MNEKKAPAIPQQEKATELNDAQLSQVTGGLTIPTLSGTEKPGTTNPGGAKLGQALKKPTVFSKSDDRLPSDD